jgi:hypothetical protein
VSRDVRQLCDGPLKAAVAALVFCGIPRADTTTAVLPYGTIDKEVYATRTSHNVVVRIMITTDTVPCAVAVRATAAEVWKNGNTLWDRFTVVCYLRLTGAENAAYAIAEFTPAGPANFQINEFALEDEKEYRHAPPGTIQKIQPKKELQYSISLKIRKTGRRKLRVTVSTNFPDSTVLQITGRRQFFQWEKEDPDFDTVFTEIGAVQGGRIESNFVLDESAWYFKRLKQKESGRFKGFRSITPLIRVDVLYEPVMQTCEKVKALLGPKGEKLKGDGALTADNVTMYKVEREIDIAFER